MKRAPELAKAIERNRSRKVTAVQRWLAEQAEVGWIQVADAEEAAGMLVGMIIGEPHTLMLLDQRPPPNSEEIAARVCRAVTLFLDGAVAGDR